VALCPENFTDSGRALGLMHLKSVAVCLGGNFAAADRQLWASLSEGEIAVDG